VPRRILIAVVVACLPPLVAPLSAHAGRDSTSLDWRRCYGTAQCASLTVPLDDQVVGGPTIDLALVRYRARDAGRRIGSLLVNPGGPGGSGVEFVAAAGESLPRELRDRFDIVGFDPRGTGESGAVDCLDDLDPFYSGDWAPDTPIERGTMLAGARSFAEACVRAGGYVLPYLTTERAARDLDRIRAALGDDQLTYLGYSYGTYLGAWYAEQFPERVRALVLDAPIDPALDATAVQVEQSVEFEASLTRFLRDCRRNAECAFHRDGRPGRAYDALRARIGREPLVVDDDPDHMLNGTRFDIGVTQYLYDGRASWSALAAALDAADRGDGADLLFSADLYADREGDGSYSNLQEAFFTIGCADGPSLGGVAGLKAIEDVAARKAPRLGRSIVNNSAPCAFWPFEPPPPRVLRAHGAAPILLLGTVDDPATPYRWAESLAEALASTVLVRVAGERHTAFASGNPCVDDLVVRYLVDLQMPNEGARC
jgi:pimeloyl-ACP methyl ester carboxylesterase